MFKSTLFKQATRAAASARAAPVAARPVSAVLQSRPLSTTSALRVKDEEAGKIPQEEGQHIGTHSRTDNRIEIPYNEESQPQQKPVQGRGAFHFKRTLASFSLEDKVGLVTGGARGLDLVMAQSLVISGSNVALVDLNKDEAKKQAEILMQQFRDENPGAEKVPLVTGHFCDVSDPDSVNNAIEEVIAAHGKIDNLVTSAGFTENFDAIAYPYDRVKKLWGVNVDGTYLFATGVARHLMARKSPGSMGFIGSMSGAIVNVPQPQAPYNASKAAVRHLGRSFAVEWAHAGIRVNVIEPGYMLTALTEHILNENPELGEKWTSLIPQGKMGRPSDLMGPVAFLCSDASGYVTGAELRVDGGYTCT